jgi:excisionase family DNA binding protein
MNEPSKVARNAASLEAAAIEKNSVVNFEPLLSVQDAAQLLGGMHAKTLMRLARSNEVPAIKIGRHWFFRATSLNEWIDAKCAHRPCLSERIQ